MKCKAVNSFYEHPKSQIPEGFQTKLELIHNYQNAAEVSRQSKQPKKSHTAVDVEIRSPVIKEEIP